MLLSESNSGGIPTNADEQPKIIMNNKALQMLFPPLLVCSGGNLIRRTNKLTGTCRNNNKQQSPTVSGIVVLY